MNLLAILAAPLLIAAIATAQAQEGRAVIGPTDFSCGKWLNTPKRTLYHEQQKLWVLGYLSGLNVGSPVDFLRATDVDGLTAWIDSYCQRNPMHGITQALTALANELRAKR